MSSNCLKAFAVNNLRARLVVFLFADPHLLKRGEGRQDGATDPDRVFSLGRSNDLDFHRGRSKSFDFFLHALSNALKHGSTTREHNVAVEILADVHVALHDRVVRGLVDPIGLLSNEVGLEENLGASEAFVADRDHLTVR
jgi:hypothetical protein